MSGSLDSSPATSESARSTSSTPADRMHVFVTVGSTRFDALVQKVLSEPVLGVLRAKGYQTLDVQCGDSEFDASLLSRDAEDHWEGVGELETSVWRFKPTLKEDYERADLVISHAGMFISRHNPLWLYVNQRSTTPGCHLTRLRHDHRRPPTPKTSHRHSQ